MPLPPLGVVGVGIGPGADAGGELGLSEDPAGTDGGGVAIGVDCCGGVHAPGSVAGSANGVSSLIAARRRPTSSRWRRSIIARPPFLSLSFSHFGFSIGTYSGPRTLPKSITK